MNQENKRNEELNFMGVIGFLIRWIIPIAVVVGVAVVAAVIFTMPVFLTPKFGSQVILFPSATNSISKAILSTSPGEKEDVLAFGEDEQVDQLLQILQSDKITSQIVRKYDLLNHYDIPEDHPYKYTRLGEKFNNNVSYSRTEFMSIKISVMDESRDTAALIANDIAFLVDSVKTSIQKQRAQQALDIVAAEFITKKLQVEEMVDSLQKLGAMGILNYEEQGKILSEAMLRAEQAGSSKQMQEIEQRMEILARYGPVHYSLNEKMQYEIEELSKLKKKYEDARVDVDQQLSNIFIVEHAGPAEKKIWPKRTLIVAVTAIAAFFFAALLFAIVENIRRISVYIKSSRNPDHSEKTEADI